MDEQPVHIPAASTPGTAGAPAENASSRVTPHPTQMPEHLIALPDPTWGLWQWVGLRGAGFPVAQVLRLATPECAEATDRFLNREAEAERRYQAVRQAVLDEPKEIGWQLAKAVRRMKTVNTPALLPPEVTEKTKMAFHDFLLTRSSQEQAWLELQARFDHATAHTTHALYETAEDKHFREAVIWQNRESLHTGIDPFLQQSKESGSSLNKQRQYAQLIAKYLQRYAAKNDTIGFFGPVGWARWTNSGAAIEARPGADLLAKRTTYFETWCLDALGDVFARDSSLLPWAVPRPMPFLFLDGTMLHVPFVASPLSLSPAQAAVFGACDGERAAKEIAQALLRTLLPGLTSEIDVFAALEHLRASRRIFWTFEVSAEEWHPEQALRKQIERAGKLPARQAALDVMHRLEEARAAVEGAAGDADRLDQALEDLEETFTELTGKPANRAEGKTYAARTLVYEDCRRDIEVDLGPELLEELSRPLALLLTCARWLTYHAAKIYETAFREAYQELVRKTGSPKVPFASFWSWIQPLLPNDPTQSLVRGLESKLQERWATMLAVPEGQWQVRYASEQLRPLVEDMFDAPYPGWPSACYHSPDLLIAATGPEAIQRGDYEFVLGELHVGLNTLDGIIFVPQHPDPAALFRATATDLATPRVAPAHSKQTLPAKRTHNTLMLPTDFRFISGIDTCGIPSAQALRPGALIVEEVADRVVARTRDGRLHFDLMELLDGLLSLQAADGFKPFPPSTHMPRVTIDRLVICRESWHFAPADLTFAFSKDPLERYVGLRRWAREHGMPRFMFARSPVERKPYYIDLDSLMYGEILAKIIRQAHAAASKEQYINMTEMLPSPEQAWLPDAQGRRYTSELRIVAVDQKKYPATV